jgi:hypothetical protein
MNKFRISLSFPKRKKKPVNPSTQKPPSMEGESSSATEQAQVLFLGFKTKTKDNTTKINKNVNYHISFLLLQEQHSQKAISNLKSREYL